MDPGPEFAPLMGLNIDQNNNTYHFSIFILNPFGLNMIKTIPVPLIILFVGHDYFIPKKDDLSIPLPHGHVEISDPLLGQYQFGQLVVMGGKKGLGPEGAAVMEVLGHGPGNGEAVKSARPSPDLVEKDQAPRGEVLQDMSDLLHLLHEG